MTVLNLDAARLYVAAGLRGVGLLVVVDLVWNQVCCEGPLAALQTRHDMYGEERLKGEKPQERGIIASSMQKLNH